MICRYHDAPLVCGECGLPGVLEPFGPRHKPSRISQGEPDFHSFRPVHRITVCEYPGCDGSKPLPGFEGWHFGGTENDHRYQPVERDVPCEAGQ